MKKHTRKAGKVFSPLTFICSDISSQTEEAGEERADRAIEKDPCLSAAMDTNLCMGFKGDCGWWGKPAWRLHVYWVEQYHQGQVFLLPSASCRSLRRSLGLSALQLPHLCNWNNDANKCCLRWLQIPDLKWAPCIAGLEWFTTVLVQTAIAWVLMAQHLRDF